MKIVTGVFLMCLAILSPIPAQSDENELFQKSGHDLLTMTISTRKSEYGLFDQIQIDVEITNHTDKDLYLFDISEYDISFWLKNSSTKKWIAKDKISEPFVPQSPDIRNFVRVKPQSKLTKTFTQKLADLGADRGENYELIAKYHSPFRRSVGEQLGIPIFSSEDGTISSECLAVRVTAQ
ncbi:MAG: hypothetical protein QM741_00055 [Rudaea sp.]|uniref:hypothetical protein n=1 Tax=Rudaea sp. TaxID=2136325 RepID=UPI0039E656F3